MSKKCVNLEQVDMRNCDKFVFGSAHVVVWNLEKLTKFSCEIRHPMHENRQWVAMIRNFSGRITFGDFMIRKLDYWVRVLHHEWNTVDPLDVEE